jgi:hypothetical protein
MQTNMGKADRIIRILIALGLGYLYYINAITGISAIIFAAIATVFLITGVAGTCPLYTLLGIRTRRHTD